MNETWSVILEPMVQWIRGHQHEVRVAGTVTGIIGLVLCIAVFGLFQKTNDQMYTANFFVVSSGMTFTVVLFLAFSLENAYFSRQEAIFLLAILCLFIEQFSSCIGYCLIGYTNLESVLKLCFSIYFFAGHLLIYALLVYILEVTPGIPFRRPIFWIFAFFTLFYPILLLINWFFPFLFEIREGTYFDGKLSIITSSYTIFWTVVCVLMVAFSQATPRQKFGLISSVAIPIVFFALCFVLIPNEEYQKMDSTTIWLLLMLYLIFLNFYLDQKRAHAIQQAENSQMRNLLMVSQIQPHFLFNSLATIGGLCQMENAMLSKEAVNRFSDYLRLNIDALVTEEDVPFAKELEHVRNYLWLEQMRFGEDVRVEFDIREEHFMIPPLTVQPLAENAVKHGLFMKENGGTVRIISERDGNDFLIHVVDDGVGFQPGIVPDDGKTHVGIASIRNRLTLLNKGTLTVESEPGKGTRATIRIFGGVKAGI